MARGGTDAEEVVLRLNQQVSGPAAVATSAAAQLETQINASAAALSAMQAAARVNALGDLEAQIVKASGALREMGAQMKAMQSQKLVNVDEYRALNSAMDSQKALIAKLKGEHQALGGFAKKAQAATAEGAKKSAVGLDTASKAAKLLGGSAGTSAANIVGFGKELWALGPYGIAAGAALAIVAAGVVGLVAVFAAGLRAMDAFRNELLSLQGAMRGNAQAGKEAQAAINAVAGSAFNALPREKLASYATELGKLRLRGRDMQVALEAAAIAGSAAGDDMAKAVIGAAGAARMAGQSMDKLADRTKKVWGGVAASQAFSLGAQIRRMREDVTALFSGATIDPFLSGMKNITDMFSASSASGQRLQTFVSGVLTDMLKLATAALPYVKGMILGAAIAGVNMYIAFLKARNAIRDWVKPLSEAIGPVDGVQVAIDAAKASTYALTAAFAVLGISIAFALLPVVIIVGAVVVAVYAAMRAWDGLKAAAAAAASFMSRITIDNVAYAIGYAVGYILSMIASIPDTFSAAMTWIAAAAIRAAVSLVSAFYRAKDYLSSISLSEIAENMITSFVDAITGGIGRVSAALSSMGAAAKAGLKEALGIHSPSRVASEAADNVTSTFATKVESASGETQRSFDNFVSPKSVKSEAKAAREGGDAKVLYLEYHDHGGDKSRLDELMARLRQEFGLEARIVEPA